MIDPLKRSAASKAMHAKIPLIVRSNRASVLVRKRWAKTTVEERRAYSFKMVQAKKKML